MKKDIDKMLKKIESVEPKTDFVFRGDRSQPAEERKPAVVPFYRRKVMIPAVASLLAAVIALAVIIPTVRLGGTNSGVIGPDGVTTLTYTPKKPDIRYTRPPEGTVGTTGLPWENGSLKLTTLSTGGANRADAVTLSNFASDTSQNIDLSLMGYTKIVSCSDGNLVKIDTQTGEHADCRGVYYNIYDDSTMCVACAIKECVRQEPYYIDACIRALIEECIFTDDLLSSVGAVEDKYTELIDLLYGSGADQVFMRGEMPTAGNLKLDLLDKAVFGQGAERRISSYKYPIINVLEFGMSDKYCLYSIASLNSDGTWGNFMLELETGEVFSLNGDDGEYIANGNVLYNHYDNDNEPFAADLHGFTSIDISPDYSFAAVTVPFFKSDGQSGQKTGKLSKDDRKEQNIFLFDLTTGDFTMLLNGGDGYEPPYPAQPAQIVDGVVCFPTKRGTWYFYYGDASELDGELLKICTLGGVKYAVMQQDGQTRYFRLADGIDVTEDVKLGEIVLPEGFTFASATTSVSISDSAVSVWSKDGRYKYSYLKGDDKLICVETATGVIGEITLPKEFIDSAGKLSALEYCLFLNEPGTQLILAYYDIGQPGA